MCQDFCPGGVCQSPDSPDRLGRHPLGRRPLDRHPRADTFPGRYPSGRHAPGQTKNPENSKPMLYVPQPQPHETIPMKSESEQFRSPCSGARKPPRGTVSISGHNGRSGDRQTCYHGATKATPRRGRQIQSWGNRYITLPILSQKLHEIKKKLDWECSSLASQLNLPMGF